MLEITCGRTWTVVQSIYDSLGGPLANLSHIVEVRSQIRTKDGNKIKANVSTSLVASVLTLTLTRPATMNIAEGDYLIDVVGIDAAGIDESLMDPEPIRVAARPSSVTEADIIPADTFIVIPNFEQLFNTALND